MSEYAPLFGVMGATAAVVFSAMGAAYGTSKSGSGIAEMAAAKPGFNWKSLIPVVMAGVIGFYGIVVAGLIVADLEEAPGYKLYTGFVHLGAGLCVGLTGFASGFAIGIVGDAGVRASAKQPDNKAIRIGMILILIFAETLGLYGFIISIYMIRKLKL